MRIIDSREEIAKIDKQNILGSVEALPDQCLHAWEEASKVDVPESYKDINRVVMTGMGGSGLGARVIESLYSNNFKYPLIRINDYDLPPWVDEKTLVICSSYSGETEETINCAKQAISTKAKWMAIGDGNSLIKIAEEQNVPFYNINPKFNPSNQPRMAIGYSIIGQLVLVSKVGLFVFGKRDVDELVTTMRGVQSKINVGVTIGNEAKELAVRMVDKIVTFFSSGHMVGATHVVNNQLNENAKVFSTDYQIPEINHHLMEGLSHPEVNRTALFAIFVNSNLYPDRIRQRFSLTEDVVKKHDVEVFEYRARAKNELSQNFEFIQFGEYVNLYLSILYGQDPGPLPWVDYFKNKLGQPLGK